MDDGVEKVFTDFDKRMKAYEFLVDHEVPSALPMIIRVDGKSFHTWTRYFKKPVDSKIVTAFTETAYEIAKKIQKCAFVFLQSDEVSFIIRNDLFESSNPWLGNRIQKISSVVASMFTAIFNEFAVTSFGDKYPGLAFFDARCYPISSHEILNYLIWRQRDCSRNAVTSFARYELGKKDIFKKNSEELEKMLLERNVIVPVEAKRGLSIYPVLVSFQAVNKKTNEPVEAKRKKWHIEVPEEFSSNREKYTELIDRTFEEE